MIDSIKLDPRDLECLAYVAEGNSDLLPESTQDRLLVAGLVRKVESRIEGQSPLELTPAGLRFIRSSDQ
jgi:hypothetical protein